MKISEPSVSALAKIVTGDSQISPHKSRPVLVRLFCEFGANDVYGQGIRSRWYYAEEKIRSINGTAHLRGLIRAILDPRDWLERGRRERDPKAVEVALQGLRDAARNGRNTIPAFMACAHAYCTRGEQMDVLREVYGVYKEPVLI